MWLSYHQYLLYYSEIPQELVSKAEGGQVELDMEDHRDEEYVAPKQPRVQAFSGSGQTLGSQVSFVSLWPIESRLYFYCLSR